MKAGFSFPSRLVWALFAACFVSLFICCAGILFPGLSARMDNIVYDAWLSGYASPPENSSIAVIDIDESSMRKVGQLPWPRTTLSELVDILLGHGVSAIGLDIWLTEPDRSSPIAVDNQLEKDFGLNLDFTKLPVSVLDNDRYFRNSLSGKPVVLCAYASFEGKGDFPAAMPEPVKVKFETGDEKLKSSIAQMDGLMAPLPIFTDVAPIGIMNVKIEDDGIVRSMPLLSRAGNNFYSSIALRTLMAARKINELELTAAPGATRPDTLRMGSIDIPLEKDGSFRMLYYGPAHTFPYLSAADVLDGKVGKKELKGKIVFIGTSTHSLQNERSTPLDPGVPLSEIHATAAENILSREYVRLPLHNSMVQCVSICLSAILAAILFSYAMLPVYVFSFLLLTGSYFFISWLSFLDGKFISPVGAILALIMVAIVILPFRYRNIQAERRKLRRVFSHYVAPEVFSSIVSGGEQLLSGQQKEVTILFTDLRGFTTIAETMPPQKLVNLLNRYFTPMTACVTRHQGTLDKFIGDALMAFWNAPLDINAHARQAVLAAQDMQAELTKMQPDILKEFGINLQMGIGINSGTAHVGNMGSTDLLDYTCIGENVNLASRLEGMCKRYGVNIVVSESVRNASEGGIEFMPLDKILVKGSKKPEKIYTPLGKDIHLEAAILTQWKEALNDYFAGNFEEAAQKFAQLANVEFLRKASTLFRQRCQDLKSGDLTNWNGVWAYQDK